MKSSNFILNLVSKDHLCFDSTVLWLGLLLLLSRERFLALVIELSCFLHSGREQDFDFFVHEKIKTMRKKGNKGRAAGTSRHTQHKFSSGLNRPCVIHRVLISRKSEAIQTPTCGSESWMRWLERARFYSNFSFLPWIIRSWKSARIVLHVYNFTCMT